MNMNSNTIGWSYRLNSAHEWAHIMEWNENQKVCFDRTKNFGYEVAYILQKNELQMENEEVYVDANGTWWFPATSWAYAQVCKALSKSKIEKENIACDMRKLLQKLKSFAHQYNIDEAIKEVEAIIERRGLGGSPLRKNSN